MYEVNFCKANFCNQKAYWKPNITDAQHKTQGFAETHPDLVLDRERYIHRDISIQPHQVYKIVNGMWA